MNKKIFFVVFTIFLSCIHCNKFVQNNDFNPKENNNFSKEEAYIGIHISNLDENNIKTLKTTIKNGVFVTKITPNSSAHKGGILPRDIIISIENKPILSNEMLMEELKTKKIGDKINFEIIRDNKKLNVIITLEKLTKFN